MDRHWTFKTYVTPKGTNIVEAWKEDLSVKFKARVDRIVAHLETQKDMRCRWFSSYKTSDKIYELRLDTKNTLWRPLGCFGPGENEFTVLFIAVERGDKLVPKNAIQRAEKIRELILKDRKYTDDFV